MTAGNSNTGQSGSAGYIRGENGGVVRIGDNVYAGKDGNVYRKGSGGWEQYSGSGWDSVNRPTPAGSGQGKAEAAQRMQNRDAVRPSPQPQSRPMPSSQQIQSLNRQADARSMGQTRTMSNPSFGGGGMRMSGGGRR